MAAALKRVRSNGIGPHSFEGLTPMMKLKPAFLVYLIVTPSLLINSTTMALADDFRVDAGLALSTALSLRTAGTTVDSLVLAERSQGLHN